MTISVGGNNKGNNDPKAAAAAPAPAPAPAPIPATPVPTPAAPQVAPNNTKPQVNPQPQGNKMQQVSATHNYGMSRASTSLAMSQLLEVVNKISENESQQFPVKFTYHSLDREKANLNISALVVAAVLRNPGTNERYVAHHTLLLEATNVAQSKIEQNFGKAVRYERLIIAADGYDKAMRARVEDIVKATYPDYKLVDADATRVPRTLDLKSETAVRNLIANATTAASTLLTSIVANDGWTINPESIKNVTFKNDIKSSFLHFTDLTDQPVRSDIVFEMSQVEGRDFTANNTDNEFVFNNSRPRKLITQMFGYIDLTSTPPDLLGTASVPMMGGFSAESLKIYSPRLVLTNIDAPEDAGELQTIIQALGTLQVLQNNQMWKAVLLKQYKDGAAHMENGVNLRDLAVIGLEAPLPTQAFPGMAIEAPKPARIPTLNNAAINEGAAMGVINTYFHNDLLVSMDVEECGPSSWMLGIFVAAARGDQDAIRDLFQATDLLTGNKFSPIYKSLNNNTMPPPIFNDNLYINLGYYESGYGRRDSRDCDYLTVLNATGDSSLDKINDWANLQANAQIDPMFRLHESRKIMEEIFQSMTITGRAARITINPVYIFAIAAAVAEAGLTYETEMGIAQPTSTARMVAPYMRNLHTNLGNAGAFAQAGMHRPSANQNGNSNFGSYSRRQDNTGSNNGF